MPTKRTEHALGHRPAGEASADTEPGGVPLGDDPPVADDDDGAAAPLAPAVGLRERRVHDTVERRQSAACRPRWRRRSWPACDAVPARRAVGRMNGCRHTANVRKYVEAAWLYQRRPQAGAINGRTRQIAEEGNGDRPFFVVNPRAKETHRPITVGADLVGPPDIDRAATAEDRRRQDFCLVRRRDGGDAPQADERRRGRAAADEKGTPPENATHRGRPVRFRR